MDIAATNWADHNRTRLNELLAIVKQSLAGQSDAGAIPEAEADGAHTAIDALAHAFALSPFEQAILLLCAGMELDSEFPSLCAAALDDPARPFPTFGLALARLPDAHWSALGPEGALRRWRLIEVAAGPVLTRAALRIDERVLHYLLGISPLDERLASLLEVVPTADELVSSHKAIAAQIAASWVDAGRGRSLPIVQLSGPAADCLPIAASAAAAIGLRVAVLPAERLPQGAQELDTLLRLWEREAVLSRLGVLLIDIEEVAPADTDPARLRDSMIARLLERIDGPLILREREPRRILTRPAVVLAAGHPSPQEQLTIWRDSLTELNPGETVLAQLSHQFSFSAPAIRALTSELRAQAANEPAETRDNVLWGLCRRRLRSALDGLAQRIESHLRLEDLVLPAPEKDTLRTIVAQLRQRAVVYGQWGFAAKSRRGLGLSALFHGPSGTGKTMAAEVLASLLGLDLYHIDLARIVSKYIGETEKNLGRVFDAAEENGAILLFDEADSLFGTRTEVKDSHDRYANIEVSYLLQRMEAYRGLAILTTNMRGALDPAFLRRLRFIIAFPFPDVPQRVEIWRRIFPDSTPTLGLRPERLAELRIAGGNIRNIALNAAFIAADAGEPVQMHHLRIATNAEYAKLDRRLSPAENAAWG